MTYGVEHPAPACPQESTAHLATVPASTPLESPGQVAGALVRAAAACSVSFGMGFPESGSRAIRDWIEWVKGAVHTAPFLLTAHLPRSAPRAPQNPRSLRGPVCGTPGDRGFNPVASPSQPTGSVGRATSYWKPTRRVGVVLEVGVLLPIPWGAYAGAPAWVLLIEAHGHRVAEVGSAGGAREAVPALEVHRYARQNSVWPVQYGEVNGIVQIAIRVDLPGWE